MKAATVPKVVEDKISPFQSTPPVKAATDDAISVLNECEISIHAAREGGDSAAKLVAQVYVPCQSTPPVKAATSPPNRA